MQPIYDNETQYHFFQLWIMSQAELRNMSIEQFNQACGLNSGTLAEIINGPGIPVEPKTCIALAQITGEPLEKIYKVAGIEYRIVTEPGALTVQKYYEILTPALKEEFLALIRNCESDRQAKQEWMDKAQLGFTAKWSFYGYLKKYFDIARADAELGLFVNRTSFADSISKCSRSRGGNRYARHG
jgi:hypothetical protein